MASYINMKKFWSVSIISKYKFSAKEKDFIADLIDSECHNATRPHRFILHDILERNSIFEAIIEGPRVAAKNLRRVLIANIGRSKIQ